MDPNETPRWWSKSRKSGTFLDKPGADVDSDSSSVSKTRKVGIRSRSNCTAAAVAAASPIKEPDVGSSPFVKVFYERPDSTDDHIYWVERLPQPVPKPAPKSQDKVGINVYHAIDRTKPVVDGRYQLKYHKLEVKNPWLLSALKPIFKAEGIEVDENKELEILEPFRPLYFCYDAIVAKCKSLDDAQPDKPLIALLIKLTQIVLAPVWRRTKELEGSQKISFDLTWTLFQYDRPVISLEMERVLISKVRGTVTKGAGSQARLVVLARILSFNGKEFAWEDTELEIPVFEDTISILDLDHTPLDSREDAAETIKITTARGRRVLDFQGLSCNEYQELAWYEDHKLSQKYNVHSRVIIDVVGYFKHHSVREPSKAKDQSLKSQVSTVVMPKSKTLGSFGLSKISGSNHGWNYRRDHSPDEDAASRADKVELPRRPDRTAQQTNRKEMLARPEDLMYLYPWLEGYSLEDKLWMLFYVEDIKEAAFDETAFDHLAYEDDQKDLVFSLVASHKHTSEEEREDPTMTKGSGLKILLSGPLGTEKTFMAAALADCTQRPLHHLQASDLGNSTAEVILALKKAFEMATEWDAVILLDEADALLAKRQAPYLPWNELASAFLRELDYFPGVIFLSSSLPDSELDPALLSKADLHLLFRPLGLEDRGTVWRRLLESHFGTDAFAGDLARWQLSRAEIERAVGVAARWCKHEEHPVSRERLLQAVRATKPRATLENRDSAKAARDA